MAVCKVSFLFVSLSIVSCTSLAFPPIPNRELKPPNEIAFRMFPMPSLNDLPIVTNKSPDKTSPIIPLTAFRTASSKPPTRLLNPSLSTSMMDRIHPTMGTSLRDSDVLPITSLNPFTVLIIPLYASYSPPEESCCNPPNIFSMLAFSLVAVSDTFCWA